MKQSAQGRKHGTTSIELDKRTEKLCHFGKQDFNYHGAAYGFVERTYYHFRNDNAPVLQLETDERYFSFVVKTSFADSHRRFDQCGIAVYLDAENWLKASVEYENGDFQHLGSVVTNFGYSDWATTEISAAVKTMWYRLSRREDDYCIECSEDGVRFRQMRVCHLHKGNGTIRFGVYACSPEESSFTAVFTDFAVT